MATFVRNKNALKRVEAAASLSRRVRTTAVHPFISPSPFISTVSKAHLNEYSEKIEVVAAKLDVTESSTQDQEPSFEAKVRESPTASEGESIQSPRGLRRRFLPSSGNRSPSSIEDINNAKSIKLDAAAHAHIEKHR